MTRPLFEGSGRAARPGGSGLHARGRTVQVVHNGRPRAGSGRVVKAAPLVALGTTLIIGTLAGSADAYLSRSSSGSARAGVLALKPVVVERAAVIPGDLFPGQRSGLSLRIKNPNHVALRLVGVSQRDGSTAVSVVPASTSCSGSRAGVSVSSMVASGLTGYSLSPTGITTVVLPTGEVMSTATPSGCQTRAFHIKVTVAVRL